MPRRLALLTLLAALPPAAAQAEAPGPSATAAKAPVFSRYTTISTGGATVKFPRRAVIVGRSPFTIPITLTVANGERRFHTTLTRKGAAKPSVDVTPSVHGASVLTLALPRSVRAGTYTLRITVLKGRTRVGSVVRSPIAIS
jgi:hypothetical protein